MSAQPCSRRDADGDHATPKLDINVTANLTTPVMISAGSDLIAIHGRTGTSVLLIAAGTPAQRRSIWQALAKSARKLAGGEVPATSATKDELASRVAELEEALLAAGQLLWPGDGWGPRPDGPRGSYAAYLSEVVHDVATEVRDAWKARGWRRG